MTFKEQLQEARKAAGLSQEQLAKLMNMSRQGVSHFQTRYGNRRIIRFDAHCNRI